jgi:hypothetical protein
MSKVTYFLRNINVLNGLLLLAVSAAVYYSVIPFLNVQIKIGLPAIPGKEISIAQAPNPLLNPSPADYFMVSEQNLFHPERRIPPEKKEEVKVPKPDLVLYGTLITSELSVAFIEDKNAPYHTPGRGKRQTQLKKGASLNGYILQEVKPDRIVLVKENDKIVFMLDDTQKQRTGETPMTSMSPDTGMSFSAPSTPQTVIPSTAPAAVPSAATRSAAPAVAPTGLPPALENPDAKIPSYLQRKLFLMQKRNNPGMKPASPSSP